MFGLQNTNYFGAFPANTTVLTAYYAPLTITFSSGVTELGLNVEGLDSDFDTFTFSAYDEATLLDMFTAPAITNPRSPMLSCLGVYADSGSVITSIQASSTN